MKLALDHDNHTLVRARSTGERALCPECTTAVIAHTGPLVTPYWAHEIGAGLECSRRSWEEGSGTEGETIGWWHEAWQEAAHLAGHRIEVPIGDHRADIVCRSGLVIELHASARGGQDPAVTRSREATYGLEPLGMIWLVRQAREHELNGPWFRGAIHQSLTHLQARTYFAGDVTAPVHAVTFAPRISRTGTPYVSATQAHSWPDGHAFLDWAQAWTNDHLEPGGFWRHGSWHRAGAPT